MQWAPGRTYFKKRSIVVVHIGDGCQRDEDGVLGLDQKRHVDVGALVVRNQRQVEVEGVVRLRLEHHST